MSVTYLRLNRAPAVELPSPPDWTKDAACRGKHSRVEEEDPMFAYGRNAEKIREAKKVCYGCPVRLECLRDNLDVPHGIFGGLTEDERWALLGRGKRRPSRNEAVGYYTRTTRNRSQPAIG